MDTRRKIIEEIRTLIQIENQAALNMVERGEVAMELGAAACTSRLLEKLEKML